MIITVTPNPSMDLTVSLAGPLIAGAVQRAEEFTAQAAGKGVNISRAASAAGTPNIAILLADPDDAFVHELRRDGIDCRPVATATPIRRNLTITDPDGVTTKINSPGSTATTVSMRDLEAAVLARADQADWVVFAGSLPPGAPADWYVDVAAALRDLPVRVAIDTSGEPLTSVGRGLERARPDLIKPNAEELAHLTGREPAAVAADLDEAARAAREPVDRGARAVLATLGERGAILALASATYAATAPTVQVVSTVGAGDSSLFGYLHAALEGCAPQDCLRRAMAYGAAAAGLPGTTIPAPPHTRPELVEIRELVLRPS
jgi:1-phosphofructokinase